LICHEPYVCGTNLLQHTHFGGDRYLSHQTKYLWREATATKQTFYGERTISTKPKLVAPSSYLNGMLFVARSCCNKHTFHGEKTISTSLDLVVPSSYLNGPTVHCDKLLRQYKVFRHNSLATQQVGVVALICCHTFFCQHVATLSRLWL
jgi:hypothetical protein